MKQLYPNFKKTAKYTIGLKKQAKKKKDMDKKDQIKD